MAVAFNHLTTAKSEVDGTTFSTASISPTANALILVMVSAVRGDSINYADPTLAGCGLTWVAIGTVQVDVGPSSMRGGTLFRGLGTPSPGALTFTFGVSHESCAWSVAEATGVDTSGTNGSGAVVQVVTAVGVGATPAVTLAAFGSADNATYAGVATGGGTISSAGTGFTLLGTTASVTPSVVGVGSQYQLANDTSVNMTIGSDDWGIIGVEVKAAAASSAALTLSTIAATSALTNRLSTKATIVPSTVAAESALTNLLRSPTMLSLSQIAAQSALTNKLSAKVLLVPSTIAAQSDLPNLLVGSTALLTLSEIAAQSALSGSMTSLALLTLSTITAQSAITGAVISQSFLTLSAIAALANLPNLVLAAPVLIVPSEIAGVSAVTLDRLSAATLLALSEIVAQSAITILVLTAPDISQSVLTHSTLVFPTYNGSFVYPDYARALTTPTYSAPDLVWQEYQRRLDAPDYAKTLNAR